MAKMRLRHYSDEPIEKITRRGYMVKQKAGMKPMGFWLSDERGGTGWKSWATSESFHLGALAYEYQVKLTGKEKILYLRSAEAIDKFTAEYRADSESNRFSDDFDRRYSEEHPESRIFRSGPTVYDIDWPRLQAEGWQGIIITPYQWARRMTNHTMWYYGWDCASGCIWDTRAISRLELRRIRKQYLGLKEKTMDEKMQELREITDKLAEDTKDTDHPFPSSSEIEAMAKRDMALRTADG
jgi:hypothetical protein